MFDATAETSDKATSRQQAFPKDPAIGPWSLVPEGGCAATKTQKEEGVES